MPDGSYSQEYGVFCVFSFFMMLYIVFAGGLLAFHTYLLVSNLTSRELAKRSKCHYLVSVRSNPFSHGVFYNIKTAILIEENGRYNHSYEDSGWYNLKMRERKDRKHGIRRFGRMIITHVVEKHIKNIKYLFLISIFEVYRFV